MSGDLQQPPASGPAIDRSEIGALVVAVLVIFAPAIHRLGIDQWVNLDVTNVTVLAAGVILAVAWLLHRMGQAA